MRALVQYVGWEMLAIHALTGALFALFNALLLVVLIPERWGAALLLSPFLAFSWWGWYVEARYVLRASRGLRTGGDA